MGSGNDTWKDLKPADAKRQIRVKICPKYQPTCVSPEYAANYERTFGKRDERRDGRATEAPKADASLAIVNYQDNFDSIFAAPRTRLATPRTEAATDIDDAAKVTTEPDDFDERPAR